LNDTDVLTVTSFMFRTQRVSQCSILRISKFTMLQLANC